MPHRTGSLARLTAAIADAGGVIGDMPTPHLGPEGSEREVTVEVEDRDAGAALCATFEELDGVKVNWWRDRALMMHEGGKLEIDPVRPVGTVQDMRDVYTPGVARECEAIRDDPDAAAKYTMISRTVAVCTNGTRVLGLGDVGPRAVMPVMEGKAVFYRQLAGISAMPILIDAPEPDGFVNAVVRIAPTFGGIHLQDIRAPECFQNEEHRAHLRRHPPRGNQRPGVLRDRGAALRRARASGDARRRARDRGRDRGR